MYTTCAKVSECQHSEIALAYWNQDVVLVNQGLFGLVFEEPFRTIDLLVAIGNHAEDIGALASD